MGIFEFYWERAVARSYLIIMMDRWCVIDMPKTLRRFLEPLRRPRSNVAAWYPAWSQAADAVPGCCVERSQRGAIATQNRLRGASSNFGGSAVCSLGQGGPGVTARHVRLHPLLWKYSKHSAGLPFAPRVLDIMTLRLIKPHAPNLGNRNGDSAGGALTRRIH